MLGSTKRLMPESTKIGSPRRSALISGLIHATAIVLVLIVTISKQSPISNLIPVRDTPVYLPRVLGTHGGGGGGQRSPLPVPKGLPPKAAPRVFTPPVIERISLKQPIIEMPPAVLGAADPNMPVVDLAHIGSLSGVAGPASGGPGCCGGLGAGIGLGAGDKGGPGTGGDGSDPGARGLPRKNATKPVLLSQTEPEYSEEARKAKVQGTVVLSIVVTSAGQVSNVRVMRSLGLGLDERAMEAVRQWKFRAGTADGKPVSTTAMVEVNFRLL
jgi:protein TonB